MVELVENPVTISDEALNQFRGILSNCESAIGVRIGIKKAGCTGYMFFIDTVIDPGVNDYKLAALGVDVFINKDAIPLIAGTMVDYQIQGFAKKFVYSNPNIKMLCGCGDSFNV